MINLFKKQVDSYLAIFIIIGIAAITFTVVTVRCQDFTQIVWTFVSHIRPPVFIYPEGDIRKFASEKEFKTYLEEVTAEFEEYGGWSMPQFMMRGEVEVALPMAEEGKGAGPERVSETTVQVPGIDEPDIVKTDGRSIYFSPGYSWRPWVWRGVAEEAPFYQEIKTDIIKAFPPADLAIDSKIEESGDLLLSGNILIVFSGEKIIGYDISDPKTPQKKWDAKLEDGNFIVGVRLYRDKIYLITKSNIDEYRPCPIKPLSVNGVPLTIACTEIYHPISPVPSDASFTAMILNPDSGTIEGNITFIGSSASSVVYMSENGIYVTYSYYGSIIKFFSDFLKERCQDIVPTWVIEKMDKLEGYDISQSSKLAEFQLIFAKFYNSLDDDERLKLENEFTNRMSDYYKEHKRELEKTGIIKVGLENFGVTATGNVPGYPLNQFALDEYQGYLRIATTVGSRFGWGWGFGIDREGSANDVYILDQDLKVEGAVKDLGLGERIYSARFIGDKGYLVTFREIDPFYVLDLSEPQNPEVKGELKIPGYSSYLHPITDDAILGIGKEEWQVKISLFDVSSPENPTEKAKYVLDEGWSDILNTHHAFLLDKKHEIFFLPGSKGGYIFSYKNDRLELVKAVSEISARRALYIDDYLYIVSDNAITVLNEIDWTRVNELEL